MTVSPYDLPSWARSTSIESYGGDVDKEDLLGVGNINPLTDISAAQIASLSSHLAAAIRTAPLCIIQLSLSDFSITNFYSQWGNGLSFAPTVVENSPDFTLTFQSNYTDEYGQSQAINIKSVLIGIASNTVPSFSIAHTVSSPSVVDFTFTGSSTGIGLTITIW
jgi:hypothetical protein